MKNYQYENIYIGAFIGSLGYIAGSKGFKEPISLNLYQQTPKDKTFGDFFTSIGSRNYLIEFKRREKLIKTELNKEIKEKLIEELEKNIEMRTLSKKGHFVSFPKEGKLQFSFYCDIKNEKRPSGDINELITRMLSKNNNRIGFLFEEFEEYLNHIYKLAETSKEESDVSGLVLNFSKDNKVRYLEFNSMDELKLKIRQKQKNEEKKKTKNRFSKKR